MTKQIKIFRIYNSDVKQLEEDVKENNLILVEGDKSIEFEFITNNALYQVCVIKEDAYQFRDRIELFKKYPLIHSLNEILFKTIK